jgi:hypothetical protein
MKKVLLPLLVSVGVMGVASATPVTCSILMGPNSSTVFLSSTCSVTPDPGFFINSLTLTGTDDYTGYMGGSPTVNFNSVTLNQSSAVFSGAVYCAVTTSGSNSQPCAITVLPANTVTGLNLSAYSIGISGATNVVSGGAVAGASIVLDLDFGETRNPISTVAEPATLGSVGGVLIGLAVWYRRRVDRFRPSHESRR